MKFSAVVILATAFTAYALPTASVSSLSIAQNIKNKSGS
jgi:hypothetical protein